MLRKQGPQFRLKRITTMMLLLRRNVMDDHVRFFRTVCEGGISFPPSLEIGNSYCFKLYALYTPFIRHIIHDNNEEYKRRIKSITQESSSFLFLIYEAVFRMPFSLIHPFFLRR